MLDIDVEAIEISLLLEALFQRYGYDFRSYARASIERRSRQFLSSSNCSTFTELTGRVLRDRELFSNLVQYFSVTVTEMFRDPFVYKVIRSEVVPLLRTWPHIKVWLAGCATGEEAYSLAIVLREEGIYERSSIYATDFNDASLEHARRGVYDDEKIREATKNYQQAGGTESFGEYYHSRYGMAAISQSIKNRITFANHNLVTDGVFGEMQLIFCRNVLIYFNSELQGRALKVFANSLSRGGTLILGTKENLQFSPVADQFDVIDSRARIYRKRGVA
jgi:chemotaxis protein methyltransferase CheR